MSLEGVTLGLAEMQCLPPAGVAVVCGSVAREERFADRAPAGLAARPPPPSRVQRVGADEVWYSRGRARIQILRIPS